MSEALSAEIIDKLQYGFSISKRLDEHRELVQSIEMSTTLFLEKPWHILHMSIQDDYLMRLFNMVHGFWPNDCTAAQGIGTGLQVRSRPAVLGPCDLPEFKAEFGLA